MSTKISGTDGVELPNGIDLVADFCWFAKAIGEVFYLRDDLPIPVPPTDNPAYRFIKLTAGDAYNSGVLTSESTSGSAPLITSVGTVSLIGSPLHTKIISLINTERRVLRAGSSGVLQDDALQNIYGQFKANSYGGGSSGVFTTGTTGGPTSDGGTGAFNKDTNFYLDASISVRASNETRPRNIGVTAYMRIL